MGQIAPKQTPQGDNEGLVRNFITNPIRVSPSGNKIIRPHLLK